MFNCPSCNEEIETIIQQHYVRFELEDGNIIRNPFKYTSEQIFIIKDLGNVLINEQKYSIINYYFELRQDIVCFIVS